MSSAGAAAPRSSAANVGAIEPLLPENVLAWDVAMIMRERGQVEVTFGGVVGFKFESLQFIFEVMVPRSRWREVFEKFLVIEPFALQSLRGSGGRDGRHTRNDRSAPRR